MRDIAPTGVRLEPSLRDALAREASINGRSLNAEILVRLRESLQPKAASTKRAPRAAEPPPAYGPAEAESDHHRNLLALFDALTPERQLALLTLLRR